MNTTIRIASILVSALAVVACGGPLEGDQDEFALTEDNLTRGLNCQQTVDFIRNHDAITITTAAGAYIDASNQFGSVDTASGETVITRFDALGAEGTFALGNGTSAVFDDMFFRLTQVRSRFLPFPTTRLDISLTSRRNRSEFQAVIEQCDQTGIVAREPNSGMHIVLKFNYRSLIEG